MLNLKSNFKDDRQKFNELISENKELQRDSSRGLDTIEVMDGYQGI